jgi:anti-sigma-K factor RskA
MKFWFTKAKISATLDAGQRPSAWLRRRVSKSEEPRGFEQEMLALDQALRQSAPKPEVPASLHRSIMQAVRSADRPAPAGRQLPFLRWAPMPALAVMFMVVLAVWWVVHRPARQPAPDPRPLAAAATALEMSGQLARAVPSAVVAPLSGELERLNLDLANTTQFLLASLP